MLNIAIRSLDARLRWLQAAPLRKLAGLTLLGVMLPVVSGAASPSTVASTAQTGVVTRVVDGDTVWVAMAGGQKPIKVRIEGIDAPEICQAGGVSSREALRRRLLRKNVMLSFRLHDSYGRVLATVYQDGEDVGRWMVAIGQAWSYRYHGQAKAYAQEEARARMDRRGLFTAAHFEDPRSFRKRHGSCYPRDLGQTDVFTGRFS